MEEGSHKAVPMPLQASPVPVMANRSVNVYTSPFIVCRTFIYRTLLPCLLMALSMALFNIIAVLSSILAVFLHFDAIFCISGRFLYNFGDLLTGHFLAAKVGKPPALLSVLRKPFWAQNPFLRL